MVGFEVPQQKWDPYLYGALNDNSRRAVSGLEGEEAQDYASLRKLLLEYYCVKQSTYRERWIQPQNNLERNGPPMERD